MTEWVNNPYLDLVFSGDTPPDTPDSPLPTPVTTGLHDVITPSRRIDLGHVYHVAWPQNKCDENSARGIRYAHRHGWSIDLDMQKDQNGTPMCDHWQDLIGKDGWYDPAGHLEAGHLLRDMNPQQWGRLTTKHGDKLLTMDEALQLCGQLHVKARIEPKVGNHWTADDARHLYATAQAAKTVVVVATLTNDDHWRERLAVFRKAGFPDCRRLNP